MASSPTPAAPTAGHELQKRKKTERTVAFTALAAVVIPFLNVIAKLHLRDAHKLPAEGPFVLSPNHYSNIDPVIMAWAVWNLGRAPRFLAKDSLFRIPVVGFALRKSGQIPVQRSGSGRNNEPFSAANQLVEHAQGVIVYPEGTLTREPDLWPMRGKTGAVRLALEHGIPLIPAAHWGTQAVLPRYSKKLSLFPRKRIEIVFGDPVDLDDLRAKPIDQKALIEATDRLMTAITGLLEGLRNEKAPAVRWNPAAHNQTEYGRLEQPGKAEAAE
ncbi:lysophospholipid acyltransferase family protein [Herbiconiux daphne]|uniref:1-acyl-sn-glycerol-3-phosphate acyltransferase n=1 Tax=Herbiconiux daphne TaxID=2970914 RepID=A0ABT2H8A8_9MICO|nr:lysophospholipid acyltransferase family protein [Herbiconiux daphne]MCS5736168.1 1-acyl-sn-glycerol-3-phosphate acyltransferase [Herbiconiux daphne]